MENDQITDEEYKKRMACLLEEHVCKGAFNARTWLTPLSKEFWLIFGSGDSETFTWINYCPYCGFKPTEIWW
jgi:hypothetical protein